STRHSRRRWTGDAVYTRNRWPVHDYSQGHRWRAQPLGFLVIEITCAGHTSMASSISGRSSADGYSVTNWTTPSSSRLVKASGAVKAHCPPSTLAALLIFTVFSNSSFSNEMSVASTAPPVFSSFMLSPRYGHGVEDVHNSVFAE